MFGAPLNKSLAEIHIQFNSKQRLKSSLATSQALLEDEEQLRKKAEDELANHLGKSDALKDEVDVLRLQVESLERNRKMLESEVKEGSAKILELNTSCNSLSEAKKKLESTFNLCKVIYVSKLHGLNQHDDNKYIFILLYLRNFNKIYFNYKRHFPCVILLFRSKTFETQ